MSYVSVELEYSIQKKCNQILRDLCVPFIHQEKGHANKATTHRKGIADLLFWHSGRSFAIELKTKNGRIKPEQEAFLAKLKGEGVITGVCRSVEEFEEFLKENGVMK